MRLPVVFLVLAAALVQQAGLQIISTAVSARLAASSTELQLCSFAQTEPSKLHTDPKWLPVSLIG